MATIVGNSGGGFFAVQGVDGDEDLLVNTTEAYDGTTLMDVNGGETTQLQVTATGPWTITLNTVAAAAERFSDTFGGAGDDVLIYEGTAGIAQITGNSPPHFFAVIIYSETGNDLAVNTTESYDGRVPWPAGFAIVAVTASGPWTITVT